MIKVGDNICLTFWIKYSDTISLISINVTNTLSYCLDINKFIEEIVILVINNKQILYSFTV